jgi:hypothetical protein
VASVVVAGHFLSRKSRLDAHRFRV